MSYEQCEVFEEEHFKIILTCELSGECDYVVRMFQDLFI